MVEANPIPQADNELVINLGATLVKGDDGSEEVDTLTALSDSKFIGVYFGAHWAPPCRRFTTQLKKYYSDANAASKELEIVFCSSDGSADAFKSNFKDMDWFAVKFDDQATKQALSQTYGIMDLPTLVILDSAGHTISTQGDSDLLRDGVKKSLATWEAKMTEIAAQ